MGFMIFLARYLLHDLPTHWDAKNGAWVRAYLVEPLAV